MNNLYHEVANIFPMMSADEFAALKSDIAENGLIEPIWFYEGQIIDGRNRWQACKELGISPQTREWSGGGSLVSFVVSLNLKRRHLNSSQRAFVATDILPMLEAEAKKRQREAGGDRKSDKYQKSVPQLIAEPNNEPTTSQRAVIALEQMESRQQAAALTGTNRQYVSDAKRIKAEAPELAERIMAGEMSIPEAKREVKRRIRIEPPPQRSISTGKQPVIINGKAEDLGSLIEHNSIDIIITSPPYNLGDKKMDMGGDGRLSRDNGIGYIDDLSQDDYEAWQIDCLNQMFIVAKPGASLFYNHKTRVKNGKLIHPVLWLARSNWTIRQEIIWDRKSTHNHEPRLFWPIDERIYWMVKGDKPNLYNDNIAQPTIWHQFGPTPNTWHPAPFTEELPKFLLNSIAKYGEGLTVLDPFMGSGTVLKVAINDFGFDAIGIDISDDFIKNAKIENGWL